MLKRHLTSPVVIALAALMVVVNTSGCKFPSKKDREEKQEEQKAQREKEREGQQAQVQAEREAAKDVAARAKALTDEEQRTETAKRDLSDRITTFSAIAGSYEGYYRGVDSKRFIIKLTLVVNNLPPAGRPHRPLKEGDILAQMEAISLDATVEEYWTTTPVTGTKPPALERVISCNTTNLKPDMASGFIRFACTATGPTSISRHYIIGLDTLDLEFETVLDDTTIEQRSKRTSDDLVLKRLTSIDALSVKIQATYVDFNGKLWRKKPAPVSQ